MFALAVSDQAVLVLVFGSFAVVKTSLVAIMWWGWGRDSDKNRSVLE